MNWDLLEHSCPRSLGIFWVAENIFRMNRYQETFQACEERPLICLERRRVLRECVRRFHDSVCIFPPASQHGCMQSERRTRLKMCEIGQQGRCSMVWRPAITGGTVGSLNPNGVPLSIPSKHIIFQRVTLSQVLSSAAQLNWTNKQRPVYPKPFTFHQQKTGHFASAKPL